MGYSFHQFKALFWKNWLCRSRQPILSLSEVLWPCTLFLILAVVRFQEPPRQRENCYLKARDLPSRGLYPFVQSLFCNVGSRCKNSSYTLQQNSSFRASSFRQDPNGVMDSDMAFLKDMKEFMQGISETTKKAATLQTLWEERSKLLDPAGSSVFLGMNLSETEKMISTVERFQKQPYFWDLLSSLPGLQTDSLSKEQGMKSLSKLLHSLQNSLAFLEDLDVMPSNQNSYNVLKLGLNVMTAVLESWNGEGFRYNLSLGDIMWDTSVKVDLESQLGFEKIYIERVLNYTRTLNKIPTKETLEQLVCSALSRGAEVESDKGGISERECLFPPWLGAQTYLVHSVDQIKLSTKIFQQWITSDRPHQLIARLEPSLVNFISLYPKISEIWHQCYNAGNTIIQYWNESLECNLVDDCKPMNVTLFLNKLQAAVQNLSQWPFVKTLLLVDAAVRNVTHQKLRFFKEALQNLENWARYTKTKGLMYINTGAFFVGLRQILMSNASSACDELVTFERRLGLPGDLKTTDVLEEFVCHPNHSSDSYELRNQIYLVKESIQILLSTIHEQRGMPVSIADGYLGWREIGGQIAEMSASCGEIMRLLSKMQSVEDASFSFCQEQLIQALFWDTLDELWFGFEKSLYWKGLSTIVRRMCEMAYNANKGEGFPRGQSETSEIPLCSKEKLSLKAVIDNCIAYVQNASNFPFTSWARIITLIKEFLKLEETWPELEEMKAVFVQHIAQFIQEIFLPSSSISTNVQDLHLFVETVLDNIVLLINSLGRMEEEDFPTVVQILPELAAQILENFQQLPTFGHHHQANVFLQMLEMLLHEFDPKQSRSWRTANLAQEVEKLDALSGIALSYVLENQIILNRSLHFFQHFLVEWPKLTVLKADYVSSLSEHFTKVLYKIGVLSPEQSAAAFSTIYTMKNAISLLASNTSSPLKMQDDMEKIVSNFYQKITRVGGNLVQRLPALHQDVDQFLRQNHDSLVTFLDQYSKHISIPFWQLDFKGMSEAFEFLSSTMKLLQKFPEKFLCEKLLMLYSYSEFQSLGQNWGQETETTSSMLNSSKVIFLGEECCIVAFQHLKSLFGIPTESSLNNVSSDFYRSGFSSVNHSNSFMLQLTDLFSSMLPLGNATNGSLSLNCMKAWIQTWLNFLEEVSKLLRLDPVFFIDFQKALNVSLRDLKNSSLDQTCNKTIALNEQTRSAVHMLKGMTKVADTIHFEALRLFSATLNCVINITSSYNKGDLQEMMHLVENVTVELHKVVSNANFSRDFLESWLDVFTPASSKLESELHSFGRSIYNLLSWEEIQTALGELKQTTELLKNVSQDQNLLSCYEILQNVTKLMSDEDLSGQNISQRWFPALLKYLLTFENATISMRSCHTLGLFIMNLMEKYSSFHPENAKDILSLLTSFGPFDASLNSSNTSSQGENNTSSADAELARKLLQMLTSHILPSSLEELDTEVLMKYLMALLQNLEKTDANFRQLRHISRSLNSKVHMGQYANSSVLDFLTGWLKNISNTSPLWNSTRVWQTKLFQEAALTEIRQVLHFLPELVSLFEKGAYKNMIDVLAEGYHLMLKQSANVAALSREELSNEVNSLVDLLELATEMPLESARALSCLVAITCWNVSTVTAWDEPVSKACNGDLQKHPSRVHEVAAEILEQLKTLKLQGESLCSDERFLKQVTYNMACFFRQLQEWQPVILRLSGIPPVDSSALNELLTFWNKLSNYILTPEANRSHLSHCTLMGEKQPSLQLVEAISNMTSSELDAVMALFEQTADFYGSQNTEMSSAALRTKAILTHLQHLANGMFRVNDTKGTLTSFLSSMHPLMTLLPAGNQLHMVLTALVALAKNGSLRESLETLWLETEREIESLSSDYNMRHWLFLIAKEFRVLSAALQSNTLSLLVTALRPLNASFLQSFEDMLERGRDWLQEYNNKNYSKIINALILLTASKRSSNETVQSIKDIISFLELFKNETNEDDPISFIIDFLSGKKLKNAQAAHLILQNNLLNVIYDLMAKEEEELHSNDTDSQIMEFIDLFLDDTQYEKYGKDPSPSQSRTMELIKEFLHIVFPLSTEHCRNKIFFLLKDLHKDIIAEMSVSPRDKILAFLNLNHLDDLNKDVDEVTQNVTYSGLGDDIISLLNEAASMSTGGRLFWNGTKGLTFARNVFNLLLRNSAIKNITRSHEELLGSVNSILHSVNNSQELIQRIQDLSRALPFTKHISTEIEKLVRILTPNSSANLPELLNSSNGISRLKKSTIMSVVQRLFHSFFWDSRASDTHWPYLDIHDSLKSVLEENDDSKQAGKVIEVLFSFLMLSRKAAEQLGTMSKILASSNGTEDLSPLEMSYLVLAKAVHRATEEESRKKEAEMLSFKEGQLASLGKAFLDLTSLMIPLNQSGLKSSDTVMIEGELVENLSPFSDVLEHEIAKCLTRALNYSIMLERLVEVVVSSVANSSKEVSNLVENMLNVLAAINGMRRGKDSRKIFIQNPKQEKGSDEIQIQLLEWEASLKATVSEDLWTNSSGTDLDALLTLLKRDGLLKAFDITMELLDLTGGSLTALSFLNSPILQNAAVLSVLHLLEKTDPLGGLPHLNANQKWNVVQDLLQTILRPLLNESLANRMMIMKLMRDFDLPFQAYEPYSDHTLILVEQWLHDQRIKEMCQNLQKDLNPEGATLLARLVAAALNVLTAVSDNPTFMTSLQCMFKGCKNGFTRQFLLSVVEGIPFVQGFPQHTEKTLSFSAQGICENFVSLKKKLSTTLAEFQRALYNTTEGNCECRSDSESIQKHMEKLTEALQAPLAGNPLMAFLYNFTLSPDVKIKDCMQNTTELAQELHALTGISDRTINIVMESSFSHPKFLSSALTATVVGRCDVEALSPWLKFPTEDGTADAVKELCSLPPHEWFAVTALLLQNLSVRSVIYKIKMPSEVDKLLNMLLDVVSNISSLLNKAQNIFENLPTFLQTLKSTSVLDISSFQSIFQNRQFGSFPLGSLHSLIKSVCREDASFLSNTNMFIDMPQITEVLEEDMAKFSIPEDSTQFCLRLYQEILQSPNGALIWTFLKPLLHGKILYSPNTKNINLVMQKANHTFGFVEDLKTYSEAWLWMTELVRNGENLLMVSQLQEALQDTFIKNFVESQLHLDVGELMGKLREYDATIEKMLNNSAAEQINLLAQLVGNISSCLLLDRFQPVESVEELEVKAHELMQQNNFLASVIFNAPSQKWDGADTSHELPKHVSYTIRTSILYSLRTDLIKNPAWKSHPRNLPADGFKYNHIFIPLQDMIERAIISVHTGADVPDAGIQVQAMPYPCHTSDLFLNNVGFFFPLIMMLTWMVSVASMVRKLVYEREIHLEEYMKTMGVPPRIHFLAWFLENVVVLTISSCALSVILKVSGIFAYSNCFLVFLFFLDFGVSITMFSYLLSVFFSSANTAALCASLMYMISFLPYVILLVLQNQLSFANQTLVSFLSTTAFGQGVFLLTLLEGQELGIHWNNIYQPLAKGGPMTFGWACWMILFDAIIYFVVGWYFSNIIPGSLPRELETGGEEENPVGVTLKSLTKEYPKSNQTAVRDLSLAFYKGHITALLGPNGAGKTTVIAMLTGLIPPSSGTIIVNGKDMETDLAAVWAEMGVCPQYDVLFDSLTVQEHLLLYGTVKAPLWTKTQLQQQVTRALNDMGLFQHRHKYVRALSGGMKRKLSVAISFIGNSKTVVLDEPTSSVDPCSRRSIWKILLKYKAGRTLIFTTHHLDEAEALSDHIAILQHGRLRCCGSPSYLKEVYGLGHRLTFTKKPFAFAVEDPRDTLRLTALVQTYIPEAFLRENSARELTYFIPPEADEASFKGLFQALDENLQCLHVNSYGISDTTLEEVFLKLLQTTEKTSQIPVVMDMEFTQPHSEESTQKNGVCGTKCDSSCTLEMNKDFQSISFCDPLAEAQHLHGTRLVLSQTAALLRKRLLHTQRDWRGALSNVLLPVVFVAMAMALFTVKPLAVEYPSLKLTPGLYGGAESFFSSGQGDDLPHMLMRYFTDEDDLCVHSRHGAKNDRCWRTTSSLQQELVPWCGCAEDLETCPPFNISVPYMKNKKGHMLYNLSALNIEEYLIRPSNKARFGGWSFGERQSAEIKKSHHKPIAKVWYNQKGFHALPSYLNQLNNFILWKNLPSNVDWKQYGITLYSHPYGGALLDEDKIMENVRQCGVALCIVLGFSILTASIGSSVVQDRVSGAKQLQHISGLGYKTYWLANFLYDMLLYLVPLGLCIGIVTAFRLSAFTFRENLAATTLLLILFGYATLPWMYLMSRFFSSSDVAFISYISLNFVCGLCTMLVTLLPRLLAVISKGKSFQNIYSILKWTFIIFPQFCLGQGLIELAYNQIKFDLTRNFGINSYVTPFEMNFLGWIFTEMALQGTFLLLLRILMNWDRIQKPRGHAHCCITSTSIPSSEDADVEMERERLFGERNSNDLLLLYDLQKSYQGFGKRDTAVKGITLGIQRRECFGLLGANGAGKSTTFKMLTGEVIPSAGRAVIQTPTGSEMDISSALSEGILVGYCPQQDALDALLTGWEHLHYYCSLRGIPKKHIHTVAGDLVRRLHLEAHADALVGTYSGGTKRKLSTALALVGKPHILLLDEPSCGMDPCSKRYLWNTITREVQDGCAAVLTSHSMEECEALCTRLAIMANGTFKCLGSPQHIKNRFGEGYSVKVWLGTETGGQNAVTECLQGHVPGAVFKGQHLNLLEYHVPQNWGCLAELFRVLESNKMALQIKHYSISQTTLEQVFIHLAAPEQEDSNTAQGSCTSHGRPPPASVDLGQATLRYAGPTP